MQVFLSTIAKYAYSKSAKAAALTLLMGITAWVGIFFTRGDNNVAAIWLPSGILLGVLLYAPRRDWLAYILAGLIANIAARLLTQVPLAITMPISIINIIESTSSALLLLKYVGQKPDLNIKATYYKFVALAVLLIPFTVSVMAAVIRVLISNDPFFSIFSHWFFAHALGIAIVTPMMIGFIRGDIMALFKKQDLYHTFIGLLAVTFTSALVFYQTRYPFLFFIPPVVIAIAANLGLATTMLSMPIIAVFALVATLSDHGPFALAVNTTLHEKIFLTQVFILINFLMGLYVANSSNDRRDKAKLLAEEHFKLKQSEKLLSASEARFRMLSENSADMVFRVSQEGVIGYVSPAVHEVIGWTPEEMIGHNAVEFTHPEDVHLRRQLTAKLLGDNEMITDRVRGIHKNGETIWMERRTRRIDHEGKIYFLSNLSNITNQKKAEDLLHEANHKLSLLAILDALTGLYNRRKLDEAMANEWRRVERKGDPISFVLLDVDRFKLYNDNYGHQGGDQCLQSIGRCLTKFARRPSDIAARYGGEELALLLPECNEENAQVIAENVRLAIEALQLPHVGNASCGGVVTVSIGVATCYPGQGDKGSDETLLIKRADEYLYEAKRTGRNKVVSSALLSQLAGTAHNTMAEEKRLATVAAYEVTAARCRADLDNIAHLAATLLGTPIGLVTLVGRNRQTFIGTYGIELDIDSVDRNISFCAHVIKGSSPMVIKDATADVRFADNPFVTAGLNVRFYAGAPLIATDNEALGALCVIDTETRSKFSPEQSKLMSVLASLATKCIESYELEAVDKKLEAAQPRA